MQTALKAHGTFTSREYETEMLNVFLMVYWPFFSDTLFMEVMQRQMENIVVVHKTLGIGLNREALCDDIQHRTVHPEHHSPA